MNRVSSVFLLLVVAFSTATIGCARKPDDAKISSTIQSKFSQDSGLSSKRLTVEASGGVVTLTGLVDNDAQRAAAARQAAAVEGVKEIVNNLQVGSAMDKPTAQVSDITPVQDKPSKKTRDSRAKTSRKEASANRASAKEDKYYDAPADTVAENAQPAASEAVAPAIPPADAPTPAPPSPPKPQKVTIEQGTALTIRLIDSIDSEKNQVGDTFHASLNAALSVEGSEVIPAGTDVTGHIVDLRSSGKFKGQSLVVLQLDSINANGTTYNLQTDQYKKEGASRGKNTAEKVGGGAIVGGIIGAIAGGGKGAAIGSAAGAGVGGGAQAASKPKPIKLPSETILNFTLQAPLTVIKQTNPNAGRPKLADAK